MQAYDGIKITFPQKGVTELVEQVGLSWTLIFSSFQKPLLCNLLSSKCAHTHTHTLLTSTLKHKQSNFQVYILNCFMSLLEIIISSAIVLFFNCALLLLPCAPYTQRRRLIFRRLLSVSVCRAWLVSLLAIFLLLFNR